MIIRENNLCNKYTMITKKDKAKLKEHSKKHEGGMKGKHMKNMTKAMKKGDSFATAHNKAKKIDIADSKKNEKEKKPKKKIIKKVNKKPIKNVKTKKAPIRATNLSSY